MKYDVICLQELLLLHEDSDVLFSISEDFDCYMIPSKCSKSETFDGRPSGGLAILWRKSLLKWNVKFETVALHDNFIIVQMSSSS